MAELQHTPTDAVRSRPDGPDGLLRYLLEGTSSKVGREFLQALVRSAAQAMDVSGVFREDLYYRLHVFPISVPPLRDRASDVELLARQFIDRYSSRIGRPSPELSPDCLRRLRSYHWPGNVRELENVIERAIILSRDGRLALREVLPLENLRPHSDSGSPASPHSVRTKAELRELERDTLLRALEHANWKVAGTSGAAHALGIAPSTLSSRMKALQIKRPK